MENLLNKLELLHILEGVNYKEVDTEAVIAIIMTKEKGLYQKSNS